MPGESEDNAFDEQLQFEIAEPVAGTAGNAPAQICAICKRPITATYFALKHIVLCPACCKLAQAPPAGSKSNRFLKALLFGIGAAILGTIIWFAVREVAHVQVGLVAVAVGFLIGKAVHRGSGGRGGRGYQIMALVLTYCCIAGNYLPDVLKGLADASHKAHPAAVATSKHHTPVQLAVATVELVVILVAITLAAPILIGFSNPISLFIQGIALWEAWKFNKPRVLPITGPYTLGPVSGGPPIMPMVRS